MTTRSLVFARDAMAIPRCVPPRFMNSPRRTRQLNKSTRLAVSTIFALPDHMLSKEEQQVMAMMNVYYSVHITGHIIYVKRAKSTKYCSLGGKYYSLGGFLSKTCCLPPKLASRPLPPPNSNSKWRKTTSSYHRRNGMHRQLQRSRVRFGIYALS